MKSKISLIILIVIIIFFIALSFFFGYEYMNEKKEVENLNSKIENLEKEKEEIATQKETTSQSQGQVVEVEKYKVVHLDKNRVKFRKNDASILSLSYDSYSTFDKGIILQAYVDDEHTIRLSGIKDGQYNEYTINVTDNNVEKVVYSEINYVSDYTWGFYFLMEDGTVRYITQDEVNAEVKTLHTVNELSNVVDIREALELAKGGEPGRSHFAILEDGSAVEL